MSALTTTTTTSLVAAALLLLGAAGDAGAASAEGASHDVYVESYDDSFHLPGEQNPCGAWGATLHEVRAGQVRLVTPRGGREDGEVHINGAIEGSIELVPDDPALPTYSGGYREKLNGVVTGTDDQGNDTARVAQYRLRAPLRGDDGSRLVLALSGKLTVNGTGVLVVSRDRMTCG